MKKLFTLILFFTFSLTYSQTTQEFSVHEFSVKNDSTQYEISWGITPEPYRVELQIKEKEEIYTIALLRKKNSIRLAFKGPYRLKIWSKKGYYQLTHFK